jgi:diguanylate cyclase (GGDEF)-like protein
VRSPASPGRLDIVRGAHRPDRLALPLLDEPLRCRAYKTLRPVTARAGSPEACDCALVPRDGAYGCEVMLAAGEPIGVASLALRGAELLDNAARRRVHASLGFGAASLASQRQFAETREAALRDALTGAHNRTFLGEFLNKHLVLAERRAAGIGVVVLDLDHFKRLNDTWGHDVGDRALVETVATLIRELRQSDAVVRLGGEEFCAVLIDTSLERSVEIAERLRAAIAAIRIPADGGEVAFTASLGVAAFPEHGADQQSLLAAADRATYVAKDAGRNQVRAAQANDPPRRSRPRLAVPSP